jgi:cellulose synthase operon protein C
MSSLAEPSDPSAPVPPDPTLVSATIARLRAEYDAADSASAQAILLHELGVLEELLGDEAAAARDQLEAANAEPEFREPLERVIAILERRQSYKKLGKLLERLVRIASSPQERARALVERAFYLVDQEGDLPGARAAVEEALNEDPEDASVALALELVASKMADDGTRARALLRRADLASHPTWRALLLIDAAHVLLGEGDADQALAALERAIAERSDASFLAWLNLEELGRHEERDDLVARSLEAQASFIQASLENEQAAQALGVPRYRRSLAHATDVWLRAAYAHRRRGDLDGATRLLDQALERLPGDPTLLHARLSAADAAGDTTTAARLAAEGLGHGAKGPLAAALWLRVAEGAAAVGDGPRALEAVTKALEEDPDSIPARALALDLPGSGDQPQALASALESTAERLGAEEAKARLYLLAAQVWALDCQDRQGARAALSQAGLYGASPGTVARVARALAALTGDATWYEEATRRLLTAGASDHEQHSLWFELGRARILRGEVEAAAQAFEALALAPGGAWLGRALSAFVLPLVSSSTEVFGGTMRSLSELWRLETDPERARALRLLLARRAVLGGDRPTAIAHLEELNKIDAADVVVAIELAALCRQEGRPRQAADILRACAIESEDHALQTALELEAGVLYWQTGDRSAAVECFAACDGSGKEAANLMLGWALRAAEPSDVGARRRALEAAAGGDDKPVVALERFALEVGPGGDLAEAETALDAISADAPQDIGQAAVLARALWTPATSDQERQRQALVNLSGLGEPAAQLAHAARYQLELEHDADPRVLEEAAAAWAAATDGEVSALAWFTTTLAAGDHKQEASARSVLGQRLGGELGSTLEASARLVTALTEDAVPPLLPGDDAISRLTNLELALPGSDPRRRAVALSGIDAALGEDSAALAKALLGYNQLAQGDIAGALTSFRMAVEAFPQEIIGWEGLRTAAEAAGDRVTVAEACAALGDAVHDSALGAELWEQAALILIDELGDPERGEFALSRAIERSVSRSVAFDRLFRIVRARKDGPRLLELIGLRLDVAEDPVEIAKLFWERARVLRKLGNVDDALGALESVTMLESDHVGALALSGEIYITKGMFGEAAASLSRLAALADAPKQQRLMSGVAAVDLYENKLGQSQRALEVLTLLHREGLSTLPVRERLARTAAKVGAWAQAAEVLEELMTERDARDGRIEAARLAMAIHRDRLREPGQAERAVRRLLTESPADGEALDLVLTGDLPHTVSRELLLAGEKSIIEALVADPVQPERVDRLARIAAWLGNAPLRQATLGVLVALGEGTPEIDEELDVLEQRVARLPQIAIDESSLPDLCDPEDRGALPDLFILLAPVLAEALGPGLMSLGISKKHRIDPKAGLGLRNEVAAWVGALGLGDFDLYVGGSDEAGVFGVAGERPSLVVGSAVTIPLSAEHRQAVARELFALKRGTTILRHRDPTDIAALVVAACRIAGQELRAPHYAMLDEFVRQLSKEIPRRVRKELPEMTARIAAEQPDVLGWVSAATSSLDRLAAIAAGDVSHVLAAASGMRGRLGASVEAQERAARLLSFVLSPAYLELREQMGMGVR